MTVFKVRSIAIALGFEIKNLEEAQRFEDAIENIRAAGERLASMARKVVMGIAAIGTAAGAAASSTANNAKEILKNSAALDTSVEKYQELSYALRRVGMDTNDMMDTFVQVTERVNQAASGSETLRDELAKIGIDARELAKKDPSTIFLTMAERLREVESASQRTAIASQVLGEEATRRLLPVFSKSNRSLRDYITVARRAGIIMSRDQVEMANQASESFSKVQLVLMAIKQTLGLRLIPIFENFADAIWHAYLNNQDLIDQRIDEWVGHFEKGVDVLHNYWNITNNVVDSLGGWNAVIKQIASTMAIIAGLKIVGLIATIATAIKNLGAFISAIGGAKVVAVFSGIAVALLVAGAIMEDFVGHLNGAQSYVQWLKDNFFELPVVLMPAAALWALFAETAKFIWTQVKKLKPLFEELIPVIKIIGGILLTVVVAAAVSFLGYLTGVATILTTIGAIVSGIVWLFKKLLEIVVLVVKAMAGGAEALYQEFKNLDWSKLWEDMKDGFMEALTGMASGVGDFFGAFGEEIGGLFGFGNDGPGIKGASPSAQIAMEEVRARQAGYMTPSTATSGGGGGNSSTSNTQINDVRQSNTININGSEDPKKTAEEVSKRLKEQQTWTPAANAAFSTGNR